MTVWNSAPLLMGAFAAAVKFNFMSGNSDISLTTTPGKFLKNLLDMIETWAHGRRRIIWACVSQNLSTEWPLSSPFTVHYFPTNPTTVPCCCDVRWPRKVLSLGSRVLFGLFGRCEIAVHNTFGLASASLTSPTTIFHVLAFWTLQELLLSPTELGHSLYIDGTCCCCWLFCVLPEKSLAVSLTTTLIPTSRTFTSNKSTATTSETMIPFLSSSTLLPSLGTWAGNYLYGVCRGIDPRMLDCFGHSLYLGGC